jgi:hypothetical protein
VAAGDSGCEAYTAIAWGVGLSHERLDVAGAESLYSLEGRTQRSLLAMGRARAIMVSFGAGCKLV